MNVMPDNGFHNEANSEVLFFDDFTQGEIDRSKWNVRVTGDVYNNEQQAYVDSPETIYMASGAKSIDASNGALIIHPRYRPGYQTSQGKSFDFISGRIDTRGKFDFAYGTAAARIKLTAGLGLWPAFWMLGNGPWPQSGEIDILEYVGEPDWVSAAAHGPGYFGEAGLVNNRYFSTADQTEDWHVYAVEWNPDQLHFTVDGFTTYRVTRAMTTFFGPWVFENKKHLILNFALGGTYPFKTNGIHTPYYGLAESTVQMIKEDRVRIAVDWVRVTRNQSTL